MSEFQNLMTMSILGAIPQSFAYIFFVMSFLRPSPKNLIGRVAVIAIIHSIYTDTMQLFLPLPIHVINSLVALIILLLLLFRDLGYKQKLIIFTMINLVVVLFDLILATLSSLLLDISIRSDVLSDQFIRVLPIVWGESFFLVLASYIINRRIFTKFNTYFQILFQSGRSYLGALIILILLQFYLLGILNFVHFANESNRVITSTILIYAVVIISLIALVIIARVIIRTREQAIQATQDHYIEDINRMFASIRGQRHDFINHLQVIHTMTQMNKTSELQQYVAELVNETQEMSEIVNHVSPALAAFVKAKTTIAIARGIAFTFELPPHKPEQESSIRTIDIIKILGNLVDNAFDEVSTLPSGKRFVQGSIKYINHYLVLEVANLGRILNREDQANIFKAGFTTKTVGNHSGLGLAVVAERTQYYGGTLELHSDETSGTVFRISIPQKGVVAG